MASANQHHNYSFVPDPHTSEYLAMNDCSTSPARKLWPFNRSRSSSPNTQGQQHHLSLDTLFNNNTSRSRKSSANSNNNGVSPSGSASSFVVKSVIRSPGGVSLPTSPANEQHAQNYFSQGARQQSPSPTARRMTLEDSDDDMVQHDQHQQHLQYRRSKSKPLGAVASLGVPPGGPGGGVGYGTARSSNDGRPESAGAYPASPFHRPASPSGSITAGDFQRGAKERGRSPRQSASGSSSSPSNQPRSGPAAAGPRNAGLSGPRHFPGGPPSPSGPAYHSHPQQHPHAAGPPGSMGFPLFPPQHAPGHEDRDESPSRSRRFSFGIGSRLHKDSEKSAQPSNIPGAAPLDGLPSPLDIPFGRSPHSPLRFDNGAETDYSRANSPFGSVSPAKAAGSPNSSGFLSTLMGRQAAEEREARQQQQQHRHHDDVPRSCSPGGGSNLAGKWFKGVFGRSPRADEKDPNYAHDLSPFPLTVSGARDAEDEAAYAQKLASMRQARHIVDEERQRHRMGPSTPTGARGAPGSAQRFDPNHDREFRPRQVVDSDAEATNDSDADTDAAMEFELGRKKSPPGRKPVPAYLPSSTPVRDADAQNVAAAQDEPLTPAQRIIQETRSKQLAREQIEAQRQEAVKQQQSIANRNPRETVAVNAQFNGPPTPPKAKTSDESALQGHQQRFPSGAHQITREPARGGPASQSQPPANAAPAQRNASTLSPGSGPMPADLPLRDALQEMMVRFYRFERYSVPLIRSLETRLLDIERDAMLASNPQARNGTRASIASNNSAEMDRWVNQMTSLMKHEVGQLKAATREIKESRELVATVARHASASGPGVALSMSVSSFGSLAAITPSTSVQQMPMQRPIAEVTPRETNVSSSTFESAVPRKLELPAGSKPALDKDEGKNATRSPTKAIFGFASESAKEHKENRNRDRSVSPNGRPRFTSVLGQPLSQAPQQADRLSPAPSVEATQGQAGMTRDTSVENRLKALVGTSSGSSRSDSPARPHEESKAEQQEEAADESGSSDIAAALAAIDASSFAAASEDAQSHEKKLSDHTIRSGEEQHHVPVSKSSSNSSSTGSGSVQELLTPTVELVTEPTAVVKGHESGQNFSEDNGTTGSVLPYLTRHEAEASSTATSPIKAQFASTLAASPTVASGRISPNKLFAHKFGGGSTGSTSSTYTVGGGAGSGSPSASAKLGLVEKKRLTLPATSTSGTTSSPTETQTTLGTSNVTTVPARQSGRISRTPSYTLDDSTTAPTSAAFSGLAKVKPVGHLASLKERVAFFDTAK
ncbi:hypothetical protein [Sporisorium scitamineum]|uniref:Uncharacterized protein n=1 Tax=Sporisorium scitamineum TaxID=49012 RepID=A0A0F7SCW0_9BASI|nr:hypothetical protein [Sporisorium scitamineum]